MRFGSNRIRSVIAIATHSSHRLIMGKEEIDNFFCLSGDIWIIFLQNLLLRNHKGDEAETWYTCLGH